MKKPNNNRYRDLKMSLFLIFTTTFLFFAQKTDKLDERTKPQLYENQIKDYISNEFDIKTVYNKKLDIISIPNMNSLTEITGKEYSYLYNNKDQKKDNSDSNLYDLNSSAYSIKYFKKDSGLFKIGYNSYSDIYALSTFVDKDALESDEKTIKQDGTRDGVYYIHNELHYYSATISRRNEGTYKTFLIVQNIFMGGFTIFVLFFMSFWNYLFTMKMVKKKKSYLPNKLFGGFFSQTIDNIMNKKLYIDIKSIEKNKDKTNLIKNKSKIKNH